MSIRMNSDEKYRGLRERMDEAARTVAQWPAWMIDQTQRAHVSSQEEDNDVETNPIGSTKPAHAR